MALKKEAKDTDLALYCKQSTIESWYDLPWACGFSSIVTAMRLLGDRSVRADQLPRRLRRLGANPKDGIDSDDLVRLVNDFGYTARSFPQRDRYDRARFKDWLRAAWARNHPTVVAWTCTGDEHDHYVCAYANPDDKNIWVMDPLNEDEVFELMSWKEFLDGAEDRSEEYCYWEAHEIRPTQPAANAVPPSAALFEWINELPGEVAEQDFVAAAFVDNFFDTVRAHEVSSSARKVALADVLATDGPLWAKLEEWNEYYDQDEFEVLRQHLEVARDINAYLDITVDRAAIPALVAELALLFVHSRMYWGWLEEAA